jgi:hypothetical protein
MNKDFPPKSIDKCRNCFHFDYQHTGADEFIIPCVEIMQTSYDTVERIILIIKRCECNNYEPLDNLKYLEKEYEYRTLRA